MFLLVILSGDHIPSIFGKDTQWGVCQPAVILSLVLFTVKLFVSYIMAVIGSSIAFFFNYMPWDRSSSKHTTLKKLHVMSPFLFKLCLNTYFIKEAAMLLLCLTSWCSQSLHETCLWVLLHKVASDRGWKNTSNLQIPAWPLEIVWTFTWLQYYQLLSK